MFRQTLGPFEGPSRRVWVWLLRNVYFCLYVFRSLAIPSENWSLSIRLTVRAESSPPNSSEHKTKVLCLSVNPLTSTIMFLHSRQTVDSQSQQSAGSSFTPWLYCWRKPQVFFTTLAETCRTLNLFCCLRHHFASRCGVETRPLKCKKKNCPNCTENIDRGRLTV